MRITSLLISLLFIMLQACGQSNAQQDEKYSEELPPVISNPKKYNRLSEKEAYVIEKQGTEYAFSGEFHNYKGKGTYICKRCNNPLFTSSSKFDSRTGWPSFDDMIADNVKEKADTDGMRTEVVCANCDAHLGHVFKNEGFTEKQTRHCVNSVSLSFVKKELK